VFDEDRYFDVFIEYAKNTAEDICVRIEAFNRGPAPAVLHLLPHLWFRNTWGWGPQRAPEPTITVDPSCRAHGDVVLPADDSRALRLPDLTFRISSASAVCTRRREAPRSSPTTRPTR
jgi:hypothetical protein